MAAAQPLKIRMVAGLGNPGEEYAETRHNAGFKAIDELARQAGVTYWKNQAGAEVALININDAEEEGGKRQIVLVKPQSYMNTSGGPISKLCHEYKIKAEELLVIHDELDIPAGDVRVKVGGGHAGHNGLRSIIDKMGSRDFSRIRTGIGNPPGKMAVADYVLKQLRAREAEDFQDTCARAADAAGLAIVHGVIYARDHVNGAASANPYHLRTGFFWQVLSAETPQWRLRNKPCAAIHMQCLKRSRPHQSAKPAAFAVLPDKTYQNKPVPFWQVTFPNRRRHT